MTVSDSSGADGSGLGGRSGAPVRVTETDLAILTAFCRPYLDGDPQFAVPAPNNEILRELAENGIYVDLDTLRGHLRNLYAKFGVQDGLNPAQKRAQLAELVYKNSVIPGWEPREEAPEMPPLPRATRAAASPAWSPRARVLAGFPEARRPSGLRRLLHDRWWVAAGVAVLLVGAVAVLVDRGGSERDPPRVGPQDDPTVNGEVAAHNFKCEPGEFCLGRRYNLTGGLYQNTRSDPDLADNTFFYFAVLTENERLGRVPNQAWSATNMTKRDVIVYDGRKFTGAAACIQAGRGINLPADWRQRVSSFRFATRSQCNRYRVLARTSVP
jgi:peptidase inhibitor family I36